jgi:hypothetical protein
LEKCAERPRPRTILVFSWITAFACVGAFAWYARSNASDIVLQVLHVRAHISAIAAAVAIYVLAMVAGGCAWYILIREPDEEGRMRVAVLVVLTAQFAKYLPGNVAQLGGRIALAKLHGFDAARATAGIALECVLAIVAAVLVCAIALTQVDSSLVANVSLETLGMRRFVIAYVAALSGVGVLIAVVAVVMSKKQPFIRESLASFRRLFPSRATAAAALAALMSVHVLVTLALLVIARQVFSVNEDHFAWITASMVVAWLAGFLVPGAPGGLGVREACLVGMLAPALGAGVAVAMTLLFRTVTTLGDLAGFLAGLLGLRLSGRID